MTEQSFLASLRRDYRRVVDDETPCSAFVREMRAALDRRLDARTCGARGAVEREMVTIMRRYLGPGGAARCVDGKTAQAGERSDD